MTGSVASIGRTPQRLVACGHPKRARCRQIRAAQILIPIFVVLGVIAVVISDWIIVGVAGLLILSQALNLRASQRQLRS